MDIWELLAEADKSINWECFLSLVVGKSLGVRCLFVQWSCGKVLHFLMNALVFWFNGILIQWNWQHSLLVPTEIEEIFLFDSQQLFERLFVCFEQLVVWASVFWSQGTHVELIFRRDKAKEESISHCFWLLHDFCLLLDVFLHEKVLTFFLLAEVKFLSLFVKLLEFFNVLCINSLQFFCLLVKLFLELLFSWGLPFIVSSFIWVLALGDVRMVEDLMHGESLELIYLQHVLHEWWKNLRDINPLFVEPKIVLSCKAITDEAWKTCSVTSGANVI